MAPAASPEVMICGAGLIGSATAYYLAQGGAQVRLVEAGEGPSVTSRASLGVLTHANGRDEPLGNFHRDAHGLHAELASRLRAEVGLEVGWRDAGGLDLVVSEEDADEARQALDFNLGRGCPVEWLERPQLDELEPGLAQNVVAALYYPGDHRVDPGALNEALVAAAVRLGVVAETGVEVLSLGQGAGGGLAVRVRRGDGTVEELGADGAVIAAGAWSGQLGLAGDTRVAVRPIRGQQARFQCPSPPRHILRHGGYHALSDGDQVVVGATVEEVDFDASVTAAASAEFATALGGMLAAEGQLVEQRAGLRPKPRKGRPVIGPLPGCEQIMVATGHYKSGVLMAPLTGQVVARWVLTGSPGRDMDYFAVTR